MPPMSDVCSGSFFPKYGKSSCVNAPNIKYGYLENFDNNLVAMTMSFCLSKSEEATYFSIRSLYGNASMPSDFSAPFIAITDRLNAIKVIIYLFISPTF